MNQSEVLAIACNLLKRKAREKSLVLILLAIG